MRPFDVQLAAGAVMQSGGLAELATGEGKTLTACLPVVLNALGGKGVHVTTVNDYLAKRDAEWIGPVYEMLGLTVGILQMQMPEPQRKAAYQCDITYGMASEFGFDFLRDRMKLRGGQGGAPPFWSAWGDGPVAPLDPRMQRELNFALVDEADSIFIDEARTPLIIASPTRPATPEECVVYHWADKLAAGIPPRGRFHLRRQEGQDRTDRGRQAARSAGRTRPAASTRTPWTSCTSTSSARATPTTASSTISTTCWRRIRKTANKVVIVDEYTGRPMPDRHWRDGLHQAVEAKEGVPITLASDHAAKITFQSYFRLYKKLAGMTRHRRAELAGNCAGSTSSGSCCVPTNRPVIREHLPDRVFRTEEAKFDAIVSEVQRLQTLRPAGADRHALRRNVGRSSRRNSNAAGHRAPGAQRPAERGGGVRSSPRPASAAK